MGFLRRRRPDAVEVVPGLWIGSLPTPRDAARLAHEGIDAVVDVRAERAPTAKAWPEGVAVRSADLVDHGAPSADELEAAATTVRELIAAGRTVLVHCHAGAERAPTVVCATLLLQGWSLDRAYRRVIESRPFAHPTAGQLAALRILEAKHSRP